MVGACVFLVAVAWCRMPKPFGPIEVQSDLSGLLCLGSSLTGETAASRVAVRRERLVPLAVASDQRDCEVSRVYLCLLFLPVERERVLTQELLQEPYLFAEELVQGLILDSTELAGELEISRAWLKLVYSPSQTGGCSGNRSS